MNLKTLVYILAGCALALFGAYRLGFNTAETEGQLALEQYKTAQEAAQEIKQREIIKDYEARIKKLTSDLASVRSAYSDRLQQLEQFNNADRDLETCQRERRDLGRLAVEGESLLLEANGYFEALKQ